MMPFPIFTVSGSTVVTMATPTLCIPSLHITMNHHPFGGNSRIFFLHVLPTGDYSLNVASPERHFIYHTQCLSFPSFTRTNKVFTVFSSSDWVPHLRYQCACCELFIANVTSKSRCCPAHKPHPSLLVAHLSWCSACITLVFLLFRSFFSCLQVQDRIRTPSYWRTMHTLNHTCT